MDATARRVRYLMANRRVTQRTAEEIVRRAYRDGTSDEALGFTAAQRSRLRHHRNISGPGHRTRKRQAVTERGAAQQAAWDAQLMAGSMRAPKPERPVRDSSAPKTARDLSYLHRAAERRASRASRVLALMRRRAG